MAEFRIVFLRDSILEASEVTEAEDLIRAVQKVSSERPELTAEIWSCGSDTGSVTLAALAAYRALPPAHRFAPVLLQ
jgi:hypothetical protein